jgi:hypothetical protein
MLVHFDSKSKNKNRWPSQESIYISTDQTMFVRIKRSVNGINNKRWRRLTTYELLQLLVTIVSELSGIQTYYTIYVYIYIDV